jgi:hypothetical protein
VVEGDTEHAAFMAAVIEGSHELADRAIIHARGRGHITGSYRMLGHFGSRSASYTMSIRPSGVRAAATACGANSSIKAVIEACCRAAGIAVKHRCSAPRFERELGSESLERIGRS